MNTQNLLLLIQFYLKICIGTKRNYEVDELLTPHTYNFKNAYYTYQNLNFEHCDYNRIDCLNASECVQSTVKNIKSVNSNELPKNFACLNYFNLSKEALNGNNFLNKKFCNGLKPFDNLYFQKDCQLNQDSSNLPKIDIDDSKEILKHLDNNDFVEPSKKELDECSPVRLDFDSLNELLNEKQTVMPVDMNNFSTQLQVAEQSNLLKSDEKNEVNRLTNYDSKISKLFEHNERFFKFDTNFLDIIDPKDFFLSLKSYIEKFICKNFSYSSNSSYLTRLNMINEGLNFSIGLNLTVITIFMNLIFQIIVYLLRDLLI